MTKSKSGPIQEEQLGIKRYKVTYIVYASDIGLVDKTVRSGLGTPVQISLDDEVTSNLKIGF